MVHHRLYHPTGESADTVSMNPLVMLEGWSHPTGCILSSHGGLVGLLDSHTLGMALATWCFLARRRNLHTLLVAMEQSWLLGSMTLDSGLVNSGYVA